MDTRGSGYRPGQVRGLHTLLIDRLTAIPGCGCRRQPGPIMVGPTTLGNIEYLEVAPLFLKPCAFLVARGLFGRILHVGCSQRCLPGDSFPKEAVGQPLPTRVPTSRVIGVVKDVKLEGLREHSATALCSFSLERLDRFSAIEVEPRAILPGGPCRSRGSAARKFALLFGVSTMQTMDKSIVQERW